jgi:inner membrane protein
MFVSVFIAMASIFGHIAASTALGISVFPNKARGGLLLLAAFCAFAPDLDVLEFRFGVSYSSPWGHRGWTHSLLFAIAFGLIMAWMYHRITARPVREGKAFRYNALFLILSTLSHPLLDMLTNGGLGVAFFLPFSEERFFFPVRPIQVSPLVAGDFFSKWGLRVLASEAIWIGLPCLMAVLLAKGLPFLWRKQLSREKND